jgi:2-polyprenyl-6-methoxyphenol hydroxylase-like FAD-dependent oxidoreductase
VWSAPGVLLVGDAAHPMSPVGAQGLNIALRDALVVANQLGPALLRGAPPTELDLAAQRVVEERLPEVRAIQAMQSQPPRVILQTTPASRFIMRWIFPALVRTGLFQAAFTRIFPRMAFGTTEVRLAF